MKVSTAKRRMDKIIDELYKSYADDLKECYRRGYEAAKNDLIECKDCNQLTEKVGMSWCSRTDRATDLNDYCSHGKAKK